MPSADEREELAAAFADVPDFWNEVSAHPLLNLAIPKGSTIRDIATTLKLSRGGAQRIVAYSASAFLMRNFALVRQL